MKHVFRDKRMRKKMRKDCWGLDTAFLKWLYPRIKIYKEDAFKIIDGSFNKFTINGVTLTEEECVDKIIELLTPIAESDFDLWDKHINPDDIHEAIDIFNKVLFSLWW